MSHKCNLAGLALKQFHLSGKKKYHGISLENKIDHIPEFTLQKDQPGDIPFQIEAIEKNVGYDPRAPHRHNYYELFFFEVGGGMHMIDFQEIEINSNEIHVLSPGQIHYMHRDPQSVGYVLKFTKSFFLSKLKDQEMLQRIPFLNNKITRPLIQPNTLEFEGLMHLVHNIRTEFDQRTWGHQDMIRNYLNLILVTCHRLYNYTDPQAESTSQVICNRFKTLLEDTFLNHEKISFYADKLNISEDKLNQSLNELQGKSAKDLISDRLLLEAKRWLLHSEKSIKEIAYTLNFQDNAYFNRWFKKFENCSPGVFRQETRKKYHS